MKTFQFASQILSKQHKWQQSHVTLQLKSLETKKKLNSPKRIYLFGLSWWRQLNENWCIFGLKNIIDVTFNIQLIVSVFRNFPNKYLVTKINTKVTENSLNFVTKVDHIIVYGLCRSLLIIITVVSILPFRFPYSIVWGILCNIFFFQFNVQIVLLIWGQTQRVVSKHQEEQKLQWNIVSQITYSVKSTRCFHPNRNMVQSKTLRENNMLQ